MNIFTHLQQALTDAMARLEAAQQADEARPLLDASKYYSHTYGQAWLNWQQAYRQWRVAYEEVCFPLTAIGVLYDPTVELLHEDEDEDIPTVKLAAIKTITAKLPVVEFPEVAA